MQKVVKLEIQRWQMKCPKILMERVQGRQNQYLKLDMGYLSHYLNHILIELKEQWVLKGTNNALKLTSSNESVLCN